MDTLTNNFFKMRLIYILTLILFLLQTHTTAQQTVQNQKLNELSGYKYKDTTINANSTDNGIPIIIGLHWRGSTPEEFGRYLKELKSPVRLILLQGQYPDDETNYSFFKIVPTDYYTLPTDEKMKILLQEGEKLSKFIKAITHQYKPTKKPIIIGASQGGDLSYVIGIRYNNLVSLSCPLLATMDNRIIKPLSKKSQKQISKIEVFHGLADKIVSIDTVKQHIQILKDSKFKVTLHTYENNAHSISNKMMTEFTELIDRHLLN
jgi:phospholipase/carboxylesterase